MSILRGRRRAALILALVAAGATMLASPLVSSYAASPGMGVVSDSNRVASWTGAVTVPTGAGCKGAADPTCDNYKLTVQSPAYGFSVKIVLVPAGDWDLSVYGPDGGLIGSSGNGPAQPEIVTLTNPAAGTYTVAAAPFAPAVGPDAHSYTASATLTPLDTMATPATGAERISYAQYHAANGLGGDAGEPSLGADLKTGKVMFQSGLQTLRASFDDSVSPANASWTDVSFPLTSVASLDPIGFMDQRTNRWFSSQLSGTTSLASFTDDDGGLWLPSEGGPGNGGVDHQTFGGGPYAPPLTRDPNGLVYPDADLLLLAGPRRCALCALGRRRHQLRPRRADLHRRVRRPARPRQGRPGRHRVRPEQELRRQAGCRRVGGQRAAPGRSAPFRAARTARGIPSVGSEPTAPSTSVMTTATGRRRSPSRTTTAAPGRTPRTSARRTAS